MVREICDNTSGIIFSFILQDVKVGILDIFIFAQGGFKPRTLLFKQ